VHYLSPRPVGDTSGVTLQLTPKAMPQSGGLLYFAQRFVIPPHLPSYLVPNQCCYQVWVRAQAATLGCGRSPLLLGSRSPYPHRHLTSA